jgi:hypothetical protein
MPYYRGKEFFEHTDCAAFEHCRDPGEEAPYTGIYRCVMCDWEIIAVAGKPLPNETVCSRHWKPDGPTPRGQRLGVAWKLMAAVIQKN